MTAIPAMVFELIEEDDPELLSLFATPEPVKPSPEIPPPVWDERAIDPDKCRAATKALCG